MMVQLTINPLYRPCALKLPPPKFFISTIGYLSNSYTSNDYSVLVQENNGYPVDVRNNTSL